MPLTTRCRHCGRIFPVYAQQLKERRGKVECPQCGGRFNAVAGLLEEAIPGTEIQPGGVGTGGSAQPTATSPADMLDLSEGRRRTGRIRAVLWSLGILLLIAALVGQIGWWERGSWLQQPQMRSLAELLCQPIGCRLDPPRQSGAMKILRPALTEREEPPDGLRLTLTLVNKSAVNQRLPQLQLEIYDQAGELAAARRFGPESYLPDRPRGQGLAPGELVRPVLNLENPPSPATGFRVKLF